MTDNRTTELRISEPLRGFIRHQSNRAYIDGGQARWLTEIADEIDAKYEQAVDDARIVEAETSYIDIEQGEVITRFVPEQAIAATLGSGTHEMVTSGTLTAEQVRETVQHVYHEGYSDGSVRRGAHIDETDWQAIADELNATLGNGTCKITATVTNNLMYPDYMTKWYELSCGHSLTLKGDEAPKWCAVCGKAVKR